MNSDSKSAQDIALENLRLGIEYFVEEFGKLGVIRIVRELVYILQDKGYSGFPTFLESAKGYASEEGDSAPPDVKRTWRRVARQIGYIVQETLMNGRELH